jgi:adenosylmethionine-8-amino-7-oxononanoate aminotransferase
MTLFLILDEVLVLKKREVLLHQYHDIKPDIICMAKGMVISNWYFNLSHL